MDARQSWGQRGHTHHPRKQVNKVAHVPFRRLMCFILYIRNIAVSPARCYRVTTCAKAQFRISFLPTSDHKIAITTRCGACLAAFGTTSRKAIASLHHNEPSPVCEKRRRGCLKAAKRYANNDGFRETKIRSTLLIPCVARQPPIASGAPELCCSHC